MIIGTVTSPLSPQQAIKEFAGQILLEVALDGVPRGRTVVAVDAVGGSARGQRVLIAEGDAARYAMGSPQMPVEAAIVAHLGDEG